MRRLFAALIILIPLLYPVHSVLAKWPKVPILLYHHIDHQVGRWHVTPEKFEKELAYLASTNYHTISLDTYLDAIQKGAALPENPIIITFDDGYDDNYQSAVPLLQKYGLTGTFYII